VGRWWWLAAAAACVAISFAVVFGAALLSLGASETQAQNPDELRPPTAFVGITDAQARSRALFTEAFKVIGSPRCMNCHPAGDRPLQGNDQHPHTPFVTRGDSGNGVPGNTCNACHTNRNFTLGDGASYRSIPGHPRWGLAPIEMAWQGKSVGQICEHADVTSDAGSSAGDIEAEHSASVGANHPPKSARAKTTKPAA
jgi:hypothetical protein